MTGKERSSGVLLHVTSLPSDFGIGDLGPAAFEWVDRLAKAKQRWWQILPLGPVGDGDSPYQAFSAFAGEPLLISPEGLVEEGAIERSDLAAAKLPAGRVNYPRVRAAKRSLLHRAWERHVARGRNKMSQPLWAFESREKAWLDDYALFMALHEAHAGLSWTQWPRELARREKSAIARARREYADAIGRHKFWQFLFDRQLQALRARAKGKDVGIIGDLPIFISAESADVWANPTLFQLDRQLRPTAVAGVPPDLFAKDGQRWGNPLYDWPAHQRQGFGWWIARVKHTLQQADLLRMDHFRGFESYWRVPATAATARHGKWVKAPGEALFSALERALGGLPLIAEDLGVITPAVEKLRDEFGLPGMKILQFAFGGEADNPHLPHQHVPNSVVYTGTHDNDTTAGWAKLSLDDVKRLRRYAGEQDAVWGMIRLAMASVARLAVVPAQDLLRLGSDARMNTPGTATCNWCWRMKDLAAMEKPLDRLAELVATYGRG